MSYIQLPKTKNIIQIENHGKRCLINSASHFEPVTAKYANHKIVKEPTKVIYPEELARLDIERSNNEGVK